MIDKLNKRFSKLVKYESRYFPLTEKEFSYLADLSRSMGGYDYDFTIIEYNGKQTLIVNENVLNNL